MNEIFLKVNQDVLITELQQLRPDMLLVLAHFSFFFWKNNLPCVVTSVFEEVVGRTSDTHKEGRAVDVSVKGLVLRTYEAVLNILIRVLDILVPILLAIISKGLLSTIMLVMAIIYTYKLAETLLRRNNGKRKV